jgi:hypothetical protein
MFAKQAHQLGNFGRHASGFELNVWVGHSKNAKYFVYKGLANVDHSFKVEDDGFKLGGTFHDPLGL